MYTFNVQIWSVVCCLLQASIMAAPPAIRKENNLNKYSTLMYSAEHDVTSLGVIFDTHEKLNNTIFFIESGGSSIINDQRTRIDFGLYALRNGFKTKLLDKARDIAIENMETAYFATKDGIYVYNKQTNSAEKYGVVNDDVISLDTENGTGTLYYLNNHHQLYKVTENGTKSTIVDAVKNAQDIMTDHLGHLVYHSPDRLFYVYDGSIIRKVEGIPVDLKISWLVKAPLLVENYVLLYADDRLYAIDTVNATSQAMDEDTEHTRFTAVSADAGVIIYYAKDKKIYELNIIGKIVEAMFEGLAESIKHRLDELRNAFN